jgi:hypothetical protein
VGNFQYAHVDLGYARVYPVAAADVTPQVVTTDISSGGSGSSPPANTPESTTDDSASTFLSDMPYTQIANGFGNAQRDLSNTELSGGGSTLTIDGQTYSKGLGVSADSDLQFDLGGSYSTFFSNIGVDDAAGGAGAVDFELVADGKVIYDSGEVTSGEAAKAVQLNVAGVQTLDLVVITADQGTSFDHADWAGAEVS